MAANYGCNLQAYALQTTLQRMGHDVEIIDRWDPEVKPSIKTIISMKLIRFAKDCIKFCIKRSVYRIIEEKDRPYFWQHILCFQSTYLHKSPRLYSTNQLKQYVDSLKFDGYVVGSDQVWRPAYNQNGKLENMFLDFAQGLHVKRVAYAASFGVDNWEYNAKQTQFCAQLLKLFDGISVREESAKQLCKEYLGVNATHVLDPTMLLDTADYNILIEKKLRGKAAGTLFCYILDSSTQVLKAVDYVELSTGLKIFTCLPLIPENTYKVFHKGKCVLPSPEEWLRSFRDAKMVLVDSFHGAVFSIIYNKPFWIIGNEKRGMARFHSLLKMFELEDRLVTEDQLMKIDLNKKIDWSSVNEKRKAYKRVSIQFLDKLYYSDDTQQQ